MPIVLIFIHFYIFYFNSNIIHGSDAVESANKEISLWFSEKEVVSWSRASDTWLYGEN
jgi:nucleoside-diphosphate kinase